MPRWNITASGPRGWKQIARAGDDIGGPDSSLSRIERAIQFLRDWTRCEYGDGEWTTENPQRILNALERAFIRCSNADLALLGRAPLPGRATVLTARGVPMQWRLIASSGRPLGGVAWLDSPNSFAFRFLYEWTQAAVGNGSWAADDPRLILDALIHEFTLCHEVTGRIIKRTQPRLRGLR